MDRGITKLRTWYVIILTSVNVSLLEIMMCIRTGNHTHTLAKAGKHPEGAGPCRSLRAAGWIAGPSWAHVTGASAPLSTATEPLVEQFSAPTHKHLAKQSDLCSGR